jgi:uncharacterized protein with GYD domain
MPGYIAFGKYTKKGLNNLKTAPERIERNKAKVEEMGVRVVGAWMTFGRHDRITIFDAPDDHTAALVALTMAAQGNVTTETCRALGEEESAQVVQRLP